MNFCPLGIRDCLFRNNSNDNGCILYTQGRFFQTQGNYFAKELLLFGMCNSKVLLNERRCLFGKKFVNLISSSIWISIKNFTCTSSIRYDSGDSITSVSTT